MFQRKHEFKPDKDRSGTLSKLYVTKKQRLAILKWLLAAAVLVAVSVVQDVILSQVYIWGARLDLVVCAIVLLCVLQDPESGCLFCLISASLYYFSGSAPGPYSIALITVFGVLAAIVRHSYLRSGFSSTFVCAAAAVMLYELCVFVFGWFFGRTTFDRVLVFCISGGLSVAVMPIFYPVFVAIGKIGGDTWKE